MQEDERRESSRFCSTSGRGRQLRDVHPRELFVKPCRTAAGRGSELSHINANQWNGIAAFPKKRRVADFSAPAALAKNPGPATCAGYTPQYSDPNTANLRRREAMPESSKSTCIPSGAQLITGVHPSRGLLHGSPQVAQVSTSPVWSAVGAAGSLTCRGSIPKRQQQPGRAHCLAREGSPFSAPAFSAATAARPLSAQSSLDSAGAAASCSRGSVAGVSDSQPYIWPAASGGRSSLSDQSRSPALGPTPSTKLIADQEVTSLPAKSPPLRLCLSEYGLPYAITQAYAEKGVKEMYPWQAAALECGVDGSNLVYCAPTSGGKSLVAEVLMLRRLLATRKPGARFTRNKQEWKFALFVLPYISVVAEKTADFTDILRSTGCKCKGFYGNSENGTPLQPGSEPIAVCTIEKANVAINRLVMEDRLDELCCVVVDEVHMLNDQHRGPSLELAITKILHSKHAPAIQIVGMSATMGGVDALSKWLSCRLFLTNFRPVSLTEYAVFQGNVFSKGKAGEDELVPVRQLADSDARDRDLLLPLAAEVVAEAGSVLVFCASRKQCQSCAEMLANLLPSHIPAIAEEVVRARDELAQAMRGAMGGYADATLERLMRAGVAWHHAGLTLEERAHVEAGYRAGTIRVLCATSTLAAGINLPARRVILRSLWQGPGPVSRAQYLQMVGRAGRAGYAEAGESYIIGQGLPEAPRGLGDWQPICELLHEPLPQLRSRLMSPAAVTRGADALEHADVAAEVASDMAPTAHFQRLLLEAIANGSTSGHADIERLLCCTLIRHQAPATFVDATVKLALRSLRNRGLLSFRALPGDEKPKWRATAMGKAVHSSSLPPHLGERLYKELEAAFRNVPVDDLLHPVFLVMLEHPFDICDWAAWSAAFHGLSKHHRRVAAAVGVTREHILIRMSGGKADVAKDKSHARFAAACAVNDLMCEVPAWKVAETWGKPDTVSKAGLSRGQLQKLQADVAGWAAMAALLSASAGWLNLEPLLMRVSQQATAGACPELLDLMQMPEVTAAQARALYLAGITDLEALAATPATEVERALCAWLPHAMRTSGAAKPKDARAAAARIGVTGQLGSNAVVRRSAKLLLTAAREFLLASAQAAWQDDDAEDAADPAQLKGAVAAAVPDEGDEEEVLMTQEDVAEIIRSVNSVRKGEVHGRSRPSVVDSLRYMRGSAELTVLNEASQTQDFESVRDMLKQQQHVAFAISIPCADAGGGVEGIAFSWGSSSVVYMDLARGSLSANCPLWDLALSVLQDPNIRKTVFQMQALPQALLDQVKGPADDPAVAAALLWEAAPEGDVLKYVQDRAAPKFALRLPPMQNHAASRACHAALLSFAVADPLRALLAARGMLQVYEEVEMPVLRLLADTSLPAASIDVALLSQQLHQSQAALATAQTAASSLAFRTVDLANRDSCMLALQSVQAAALQPKHRGRGPISLMQLREVARMGAAAGNLRAVQMAQLMVQHQVLQERASQLQALLEKLSSGGATPPTPRSESVATKPEGRSMAVHEEQRGLQEQLQHSGQPAREIMDGGRASEGGGDYSFSMGCQGDFGFMGPLDEQAAMLFACSIEPCGAGLSVSQSSLQDELLSVSLNPQDVNGCAVVVRVPGLAPGRGHLICGIVSSIAPASESGTALAVQQTVPLAVSPLCHSALVRLPDPPGGLGALLDAGLPTSYQQLPCSEQLLPCSQIWRMRQPQLSGFPRTQQHAGGSTSADSSTTGQPAQWATFSWASEPVSAPHENSASAAAVSAGRLSDDSDQSSAGPPAKRAKSADCAGDEVSGSFAAAWSGETAEWAAAHGGIWAICSLRQLLRPRHPGNTFVSFSMSSLELAALAHLSNDEALLQCLSAQDPVAQVASVLLQDGHVVGPGEVRTTQLLLDALTHGSSPKALGEHLGVSAVLAEQRLRALLAAFPRLGSFWAAAWEQCQKQGWVASAAGRRFHLPSNASKDPRARNKGERWALAAMVMGSVADLMKALVVELHASLRAEFGPCSEVDGPAALEIPRDAPVLLAVCGTEIVLECAASHLPALHKVVVDCLQRVRVGGDPLQGRLRCNMHAGASLSPLHCWHGTK